VAGVTERVTPTTPTYAYRDHEPIRGEVADRSWSSIVIDVPEQHCRPRERDRLIALGRRTDDDKRCTLLVVSEVDRLLNDDYFGLAQRVIGESHVPLWPDHILYLDVPQCVIETRNDALRHEMTASLRQAAFSSMPASTPVCGPTSARWPGYRARVSSGWMRRSMPPWSARLPRLSSGGGSSGRTADEKRQVKQLKVPLWRRVIFVDWHGVLSRDPF
jgi:hypothetical protein